MADMVSWAVTSDRRCLDPANGDFSLAILDWFARQLVDGLQRFDLTIGPHAEFGELARAGQHLPFQRADGRIETIDAVAEVAAELAEVSR